MKAHLCLILAVAASVSARAQYSRMVGGRVIPKSSQEWSVWYERIEVIDFNGADLVGRRFNELDVAHPLGGKGNMRLSPVTKRVKHVVDRPFVLINYPYARGLKRGEVIQPPIMAIRTGLRVIKGVEYDLYDYGVEYVAPADKVTASKQEGARKAIANGSAAADAAKLKFDQEQADKGKDLYQYRMGMRYLNGDGVAKDPAKARDYFSKSAAQGNPDAAAQMAKLGAP